MNRRLGLFNLLRMVFFRESVVIFVGIVLGILLLRFSGDWVTVTNPDYDPSAGEILDCSSGVDQYGNYDEGCWDANTPEIQADGRTNAVIVLYVGSLVLATLLYKRIKPTLNHEKEKRRLRKEFLRGHLGASQMQSDLEMYQYFTLLTKWVDENKIGYKHAEAARLEWQRNSENPQKWRYPSAELRKMHDRGKITSERFEVMNQENSDWFDLPENLRKKHSDGLISEMELRDGLYRAGYDYDTWWRARWWF
jgi:hypothetical protein